jgi:hypothetical protein
MNTPKIIRPERKLTALGKGSNKDKQTTEYRRTIKLKGVCLTSRMKNDIKRVKKMTEYFEFFIFCMLFV